jgi:C2H2 transcription facotor
MAAVQSFRPDESMSQAGHFREPTTPTTPRPQVPSESQADANRRNMAESSTSDATSVGNPATQYPELPTSVQSTTIANSERRASTSASTQEESWISMDVDDSDHDQDGSDNDTENGDADGSSRKKKGQRFFCTGYPPCNLSFTRSEHLARHIRKHTGERPFQCHCSRRFSRLDNLRQHAQTVHLNEEIPTDSLAATGTRFQRQIRTDRVRPAGRPRTSTMSSTGSHGRCHSRNLSASSVGSTSSNFSTTTDTRRRPPPLLMASDPASRPKLGIEPPSTPPTQYRGFTTNSPGDMSTPTSAYSMTPGSPGYGSSIGSPISTSSRTGGFFGNRTPGRRLSVPSGANPFQQTYGQPYGTQYMTSMAPPGASNSGTSSYYASPTVSNFSYAPQQYQVSPGEDWRRRTWHPSTYPASAYNYARPATSGLSYSQTPDAPQPAPAPNAPAPIAAAQAPRLPGIESFDQVQHRPSTPPRRGPSPMQVDVAPQAAGSQNTPFGGYLSEQRPNRVSWDANTNPPASNSAGPASRDAISWSQQTLNEIQSVGSRQEPTSGSTSLSSSYTGPSNMQHQQQMARDALQIETSQNSKTKRNGWYNGPVAPARTSPEGSSSSEGIKTPGTGSVEVNPVIVHSNEYLEPHHAALAADVQANVSTFIIPPLPPANLI